MGGEGDVGGKGDIGAAALVVEGYTARAGVGGMAPTHSGGSIVIPLICTAPSVQLLRQYCIVLYLQPVLNPKSYDGAGVLEASGRPMLVIGRSY